MSASRFENGKLILSRSSEERIPLVDRLSRVEGQIRGVKAMIEADRYCGDELQQIKAAIAALRRVAMLISEQHIAAAADRLNDKKLGTTAHEDIMHVLSEALKI